MQRFQEFVADVVNRASQRRSRSGRCDRKNLLDACTKARYAVTPDGEGDMVMSEHRLKALTIPLLSMLIGQSIDVRTVDDCFNLLEAAFQSPRWRQLPQQERTRLVGRLSHIMEIARRRDLEE